MILFSSEVKIKLNPGKALCAEWESGGTNTLEYQVLAKKQKNPLITQDISLSTVGHDKSQWNIGSMWKHALNTKNIQNISQQHHHHP